MPVVSPSCYELLGVPSDAPEPLLDWSRAQRRREAHQRVGELDRVEVDALVARIDEAFRILADPASARRYRLYRAQLDGGRRVTHPEDLSSLGPADEDEDDTLTSGDEWDMPPEWRASYDREVQRTLGAARAFRPGGGVVAVVAPAPPAPGARRAARRYPTRRSPPWLDLDPPEPAALGRRPSPFPSTPGALIPAASGPDPSGHNPNLDLPPWEDRTR